MMQGLKKNEREKTVLPIVEDRTPMLDHRVLLS